MDLEEEISTTMSTTLLHSTASHSLKSFAQRTKPGQWVHVLEYAQMHWSWRRLELRTPWASNMESIVIRGFECRCDPYNTEKEFMNTTCEKYSYQPNSFEGLFVHVERFESWRYRETFFAPAHQFEQVHKYPEAICGQDIKRSNLTRKLEVGDPGS